MISMKIKHFTSIAMACMLLVCLCGCRAASEAPAADPTPPVTTAPETTEPTVTEPPTTQPQITLPDFVDVYREGELSQIPVVTVVGTVGDYAITMDPEYFTFSSQETADLFAYDAWPGDMTVFFSISAYHGGDSPEFVTNVVNQFGQQYQGMDTEDTTIGPYRATAVYLHNFKDNPDYHKHVFLIDCGEDMYILEAQFYTEMYEGLYAIMRALFDTFTAY